MSEPSMRPKASRVPSRPESTYPRRPILILSSLLLPLVFACIVAEGVGPGTGVQGALVADISIATYDTARLSVGDPYYVDQPLTITALGPGLDDRLWIRTADADKSASDEAFLSFRLTTNAVVVVAYDSRATALPNWLRDWTEAPASINGSDAGASPFALRYKAFAPGTVVLGGNLASGAAGAQSMYGVLVIAIQELAPTALQLAPTDVTLDIRETAQFTASSIGPLGHELDVPLQWSATGGTITSGGLYTAGGTAGIYQITAAFAPTGLSASVPLTIHNSVPSGAVLFEDDFEGGDLSKTMPGGVRAYKWGGSNSSAVDRTVARSGTQSLMLRYAAGLDSHAEQRFNLGDHLTEVYLEWYTYFPTGAERWTIGGAAVPKFVWRDAPDYPDNGKLLRLWDGPGNDSDSYNNPSVKVGHDIWIATGRSGYPQDFYFQNSRTQGGTLNYHTARAEPTPSIGDAGAYSHTYAVRGRWVRFRSHAKTASAANNDGILRLWIDDALVINETGLNLYPTWTGGAHNSFFWAYLWGWSNPGFAQTSFIWIDDFRIYRDGFPD